MYEVTQIKTSQPLEVEASAMRQESKFRVGRLSFIWLALVAVLVTTTLRADKAKDEETLRNAASVLSAMVDSNAVPPDVMAKADCVMVLPSVKKGGFIVGGSGGRGPMVCRTGKDFKGKWSAPAMYEIGGVSVGLQAGGSATDYVLLVMSQKGVDQLLEGKIKLGSDATVAAGPTGATAEKDVGADMLTYGRAKGAFAGLSLGGATLSSDDDANKNLYGKATTVKEIVMQNSVTATPGGQQLVAVLSAKATKAGN
jgi:lipid-binding SYLF domain-containing protein